MEFAFSIAILRFFANNNIVRNTRVYNNGYGRGFNGGSVCGSGGGGIVLADYQNKAYNNIVYGNYWGISVGSKGSGSQLLNNTVTQNDYGIDIYVANGAQIKNNIVYGNPGVNIYGSGNSTTVSTNLVTDPRFVSASDFHLQSSSPAIDTGLTISEITTDIDGAPRPQGSGYDIGAYEFGGALPTPTPPPTPAPTPTPPPTPTAITGPVGFWKFDEGAGGVASDSSGFSNTATLTSGASWASGRSGYALNLDGVNGKAVVNHSNSLNISSSFTLSAWVNPSAGMSDFRAVMVKNYTYFLYASSNGYCGDGAVIAGFDGGTVCTPTPLSANTWSEHVDTPSCDLRWFYAQTLSQWRSRGQPSCERSRQHFNRNTRNRR
jgi:parallel beta-helix repeat protein